MSLRSQWESIENSPSFQSASDSEREDIRNEFFDTQIGRHLMPGDAARAREQFDYHTAPQGNPYGGSAGDLYHLAKAGLQGAASDLARGFTFGNDNRVANFLNEAAGESMQQVTPSMLEAIEATGIDYEPGEGFMGLSIKDDSSIKGLIGQTAQGIGSLPVSIGAGGVYGKVFGAIGRAATASRWGDKAHKVARAAGNKTRAKQILQRRDQLAAATNATGFGTMGGQMMTGGVASQAYDETMHRPIEELRQEEGFQERLTASRELYPDNPAMAEAHARETLAKDTSLANRMQSFGLGFVTSVMTGPIEQRILMGKGAATRRGNIARGMATEAVEEFSESGGQQLLSNQAQMDVAKREMDLMDGVLSTGFTGMVSGSLVGGALGGVGRPNRPKSKEALNADLENIRGDIARTEEQLKDTSLDQDQRDQLVMQLSQQSEQAYYIKQAYDKAPTEEQLSRNQKGESEPASDTGESQPIERPDTRLWVPADIDQRITDASQRRRNLQSMYRRGMGAQGTMFDAKHYETLLRDNQQLLDSYNMLRDNRYNTQYFESENQFNDWIKRKLKGGSEAVMADAELNMRKKGRAMQHGMFNINNQVNNHYEQARNRSLRDPVADRDRRWNQLQQGYGQQTDDTGALNQQDSPQAPIPSESTSTEATEQVTRGMLPEDYQTQHEQRVEEREREQQQLEAKAQQEQQTKQSEREKRQQTKQTIEDIHYKPQQEGRYQVYPMGADRFAVLGASPAESGQMNKLGGFYDTGSGLWSFPKHRRLDVLSALKALSAKPQTQRKPAKKKTYPKTERKQERKQAAAKEKQSRDTKAKEKAKRDSDKQPSKDLAAERVRPAARQSPEEQKKTKQEPTKPDVKHPGIKALHSDKPISTKAMDMIASSLGVPKKKSGEKSADRESRIRSVYDVYQALKSETVESLMARNKSDLEKIARRVGQYRSIYRKEDVARSLIKWRNSVAQRLQTYQEHKDLRGRLKALVKDNQPVAVNDVKELAGDGSFIYTEGDQDVARILDQDYIDPPGQRGDNDKLYNLAESLVKNSNDKALKEQLSESPEAVAMIPRLKDITDIRSVRSIIDLSPLAKAVGVPGQYAKAFGDRFAYELRELALNVDVPKKDSTETSTKKPAPKANLANEVTLAVPKSKLSIEGQYKLVENKDLIASHNIHGSENPDYPSEKQPRDRSRSGSEENILSIAAQLDPLKLSRSGLTSDGAPIVDSNNVVESGNGRTLATRYAYSKGSKQAEDYKQWLTDHAQQFGLTAEQVQAMDQPQLVVERTSDLNEKQLKEYLDRSNDRDTSEQSLTEKAMADCRGAGWHHPVFQSWCRGPAGNRRQQAVPAEVL